MAVKKYLTVDIGNKNIKIVHGRVNKDIVEVSEYAIVSTPSNSIKDGKIINVNALVNAIKDVLKENKIKENKLILNITGTGVITRDVQIPKSTDEEIEKMLEYEAQQYFPVDLENYVLDYKKLEDVDDGANPVSKLLLAAVPVKQVEEYMKLHELLKMEIIAIDLPANCVSKFLFGKVPSTKKDAVQEMPKEFAVVDIGSETTGVCIFYENKLRFNRILLSGSSDIDKLISNRFNIDYKEAEKNKISIEYPIDKTGNFDISSEQAELTEIIRTVVDNIASDINRFFDFYNSRSAGNRLQKVYICGGGSKLIGMDSYISSYFNIPVEMLDLKGKVKYKGKKGQEAFEEDFSSLVTTLGATIR